MYDETTEGVDNDAILFFLGHPIMRAVCSAAVDSSADK